ncbi:MAG TPA: hypothetical protein VF678_01550 [bacterium]
MSALKSMYWLVRCEDCGKPATAHGVSMLRDATLCLPCLDTEAQQLAERRRLRRMLSLTHGNRHGHPSDQ